MKARPPKEVNAVVQWLFRNRRTGRLTFVQFPNVPLWIFVLGVVVGRLVPSPSVVHRTLSWLELASLAWWAIDEGIRGVNPWRRFLGVVAGALVVVHVTRAAP